MTALRKSPVTAADYSDYLLSCCPLLDEDRIDGERTYIVTNAERYTEQVSLIAQWHQGGAAPLRVLDIGCYPGHLAMLLRHYFGATVAGVGIIANRQFLQRMQDFKIEFQTLDIERQPLPFPDATFDVVLFTEVIEHLLNPFPVGQQISRVLRPDGMVLLSTPNLASLRNRIHAAQGKVTNEEFFLLQGRANGNDAAENVYPTHVRLWLPLELRRYLSGLDMNVIGENYQHFPDTGGKTVKERILSGLVRLLPAHYRDMVTVIAVKR